MSGNTFGTLYRVTTFGESHGGAVGCVIDGCPPGIKINLPFMQKELKRRSTGQSKITSQRREEDRIEVLSGTVDGLTTGTPLCLLVRNSDARSQDYAYLRDKYRPSHADFTYDQKYGIRAWAGGGRASARETTARVLAGALAKQILSEKENLSILTYVSQVKDIQSLIDPLTLTEEMIESNIVRCPDPVAAAAMITLIENTRKQGDSVGGIVSCIVKNVPTGLGDPVFDKLEADLGKALLSLPACKGFEIGSGFSGILKYGSEHNDPFYVRENGSIGTTKNDSGGIQGGISNGEPIFLKAAFKPTATILKPQKTVDRNGKEIVLDKVTGRHDPCVTPRAVPIVESMVAITLMDHYLRQKSLQ